MLFVGTGEMADRAAAAVTAVAPGITAFNLVDAVLQAIVEVFDPSKRTWYGRRQAVVDHNPELRERDLIKRQTQNEAIATALRDKGLDGMFPDVVLALIGLASHATYTRWIEASDDRDVSALAAEVLAELRTAITALNQGPSANGTFPEQG